MKKAAIIYRSQAVAYSSDTVINLKNLLEKKEYSTRTYDVLRESQRIIFNSLENEEPDLLVTFDMEGFEQRTQTGNLFYNLLSCKMIHFLFGNKNKYRDYLSGKLSLAMFFFCADSSEAEVCEMKEMYCNIQHLERVSHLGMMEMEEAVIEVERESGWLKDECPSAGGVVR